MALLLPVASDRLNSPGHSFLHRVVAVDDGASEQTVKVTSAGVTLGGVTTTGAGVTSMYRAITALRTLDATDYVVDCTTGTYNVTLPTAAGITGRTYIIKNSGTGVITIVCNGVETIDGNAVLTLACQYTSVTVISNGTNWSII